MPRDKKTLLRKFHQAKWDEDIIFEMSVPGERGIIVPRAEKEIQDEVGDGISVIPDVLRRRNPPALPEVNQVRVLRHFTRLSQETMGVDVTMDISMATCTMKYSPKVQEHVAARDPHITELHPLQDVNTLQGVLEMYWKLEHFLKEISGMDHFCLQPGGGAQAIFTNACMIRAYHEAKGESNRNEIITTIFSHPANAGAPATAGYKVITLMPDERGYPDLNALKAALSEKTAGLFITNPEDTGIYNPNIDEYVRAAHAVGALCSYDQANANAILGIARARETGFDLCHFNLHKTFSAPHGCMGPALGATGVTDELAPYLPINLGIVLEPKFIPGLTLTADYWRVKQTGLVGTFGDDNAIALDLLRRLGGSTNPNVIRAAPTADDIALFTGTGLAPTGRIIQVLDPYLNLDSRVSKGWDFGLAYHVPDFGAGEFRLRLNAARLKSFVQSAGADGEELLAGIADGRSAGRRYCRRTGRTARNRWSAQMACQRIDQLGEAVRSRLVCLANIPARYGTPAWCAMFCWFRMIPMPISSGSTTSS